VALQEIALLGLASGRVVELVMIAVLQLSHEEVAGVDLAVDSDFRVGHQIITDNGE
jgi:hypothetical protein